MSETRMMRFPDTDYATIKAYDCGDAIVVKYFDFCDSRQLQCPFCHWCGPMPTSSFDLPPLATQLCCPDCSSQLASISRDVCLSS